MASIMQGGKKSGMGSAAADMHHPEHDMDTGETRSTLVSHSDGSHHIEHEDGSTTDHPHIGHALMHMAGKHSDGMHHHTHHDGMGGNFTTHHAAHGGEPEGPHDHENLESVKDGLNQFFGEEEKEGDWGGKDGESGSEGKDY